MKQVDCIHPEDQSSALDTLDKGQGKKKKKNPHVRMN